MLENVITTIKATDAVFRSGFCWGLIAALIIGTAARVLLYFLGPILNFFKPSRSPATNAGPSPFDKFVTCLTQIVIGLILLVAGAIVFYMIQ